MKRPSSAFVPVSVVAVGQGAAAVCGVPVCSLGGPSPEGSTLASQKSKCS